MIKLPENIDMKKAKLRQVKTKNDREINIARHVHFNY